MAVSVFRAHAAHFVVFGLPVLALVGAIGWQEARARLRNRVPARDARPAVPRSAATWIASAGLLVAGVVHLSIIREHFDEYFLYGLFFTALALVQVAIAVWVAARPDRAPLAVIAFTSAWVVVLWLVSRTTGLPIGPEPWKPEEWGALDAIASAAELATVVACAATLHHNSHKSPAGVRAGRPVVAR